MARHVGARTALTPDEYGCREGETASQTCIGSLLSSRILMDSPGMALAVDLWLGAGSAEALREAAENPHASREKTGEQDG